ncbi:Bax inhibitor-1/YccA family protein [soil metagenome]
MDAQKGTVIVHPSDRDPLNRAQPSGGQAVDPARTVVPNTLSDGVRVSSAPREGFLTASFVWMFVGVLLSAASATFLMNNADLQARVMDVWLFLLIGQLALVLAISFLITRIPPLVALGLFFAYALAMGLVIGVVVLAYSQTIGLSGVVSAFVGAAAIFGGAAVYGGLTGRDLTSLGGILFIGLIGLIVVVIVQLFFFPGNGILNLAIGIVGVVIFTGLTAWDVQRIKNGNIAGINAESASVMGALALYLDFVNLFLFMLRIFGSSR